MDEIAALIVVLIAVVAVMASGSVNGIGHALNQLTPAAVIGAIGAVTTAGFRKRDLHHRLGALYTMTQDICRAGLADAGRRGRDEPLELKAIEWWRAVRECKPLLSARGYTLLAALNDDILAAINGGRARYNSDTNESAGSADDIARLKRIAAVRERITADRDLLITRWPERLDFIRSRIPR